MTDQSTPEVEPDTSAEGLTEAQLKLLDELADAMGQDRRTTRLAFKQKAGMPFDKADTHDVANILLEVADKPNTTPVVSDGTDRWDVGTIQAAFGQTRVQIERHDGASGQYTSLCVDL